MEHNYPKQMYKGSYSSAAVSAEEMVVHSDKEEKAARAKGFIDGNEFFSKPATDHQSAPIAKPADKSVPPKPEEKAK